MERIAETIVRFFFKTLLMVEIGICYFFGLTEYQNISEIVEEIKRFDPFSLNENPFIF
jgi:hypothetical protein